MSNCDIFNFTEAQKLLPVYKKKRHYSKVRLLTELISWQGFFGNKTIVGVKISTEYRYKRKTIQIVLNDLGYIITSYRTITINPYCYGTSITFTEFTFTPKNLETTEG